MNLPKCSDLYYNILTSSRACAATMFVGITPRTVQRGFMPLFVEHAFACSLTNKPKAAQPLGGAGNFACSRLSGGALAAVLLPCAAGWQPASRSLHDRPYSAGCPTGRIPYTEVTNAIFRTN